MQSGLAIPYLNDEIASADFVTLAKTGEDEIAQPVPKRKRGISLLAKTEGMSLRALRLLSF